MTNYPGAIDLLEACENEAVLAVESTLGVNPQGVHASVIARLNAVDLRIALSERIFKASEYGGIQQTIDAAFAAGGGTVLIPWGVTVATLNATTGTFYTLKPNVSLIGYGPQSVIKVPDNAGNYKAVFHHDLADSIDDVTFSNFAIDGNAANNAVTYPDSAVWVADLKPRMAFMLYKAQRTTIAGMQIRGLDCINTISVNGVAVEDCAVVDCYFDTPLSPIDHDHSTIYLNGVGCRAQDNHLIGHGWGSRTAIETHGSLQLVTGNIERGYDQFGVIVVSSNTLVKDNLLSKPVSVGWGSTLTGLQVAA